MSPLGDAMVAAAAAAAVVAVAGTVGAKLGVAAGTRRPGRGEARALGGVAPAGGEGLGGGLGCVEPVDDDL